jgi:DNA processing protein
VRAADTTAVKLAIDQPDYPRQLLQLPNPPRLLAASGSLLTRRRAVAIVGSRRATQPSLDFAFELAFQLAAAGVRILSGGAVGIDGAAHRGALAAGGVTWVVSPAGRAHLYPPRHRALFEEIAGSEESRMLWPFADDEGVTRASFLYRNGVLAALSETLVVVQARLQSGSRNAVAWARDLGRPVWAMTAAPWMEEFSGSSSEIELGRAQPLCSAAQLLRALELEANPGAPRAADVDPRGAARGRRGRIPAPPSETLPATSWTPDEITVFSATCRLPMHVDQILEATGLAAPPAATALLTLALKDVVVEGPSGFFRRKTAG